MQNILIKTRISRFTLLILLSFVLLLFFSFKHDSRSSVNGKFLGIGTTGPIGVGDTSPTPTVIISPTDTPTPIPSPTPTPVMPPQVTITNPQNGGTVKHNSSVTITASAMDDVAIQRVDFYVNSVFRCSDTLAPYSCVWVVPSKPRITYSLEARAFDTSGNSASNLATVTSQ